MTVKQDDESSKTVDIVLPDEYDNKWLRDILYAFTELDIQVKFVAKPTTAPVFYPHWTGQRYYYQPDYPYTTYTNTIISSTPTTNIDGTVFADVKNTVNSEAIDNAIKSQQNQVVPNFTINVENVAKGDIESLAADILKQLNQWNRDRNKDNK